MKLKLTLPVVLTVWLVCANYASAQGTAFTYQGQLTTNGIPVTGIYIMSFTLYSTSNGDTIVGGPVSNFHVPVTNGLFTVMLDFGSSPFTGNPVWLGMEVATNNSPVLTSLAPRQELTPGPYAIFATTASNLVGTLPAGSLSGAYGDAVTLNNPANSFSGNGAGLTEVNAAMLNGYDYCSLPCYWNLTGNAGTTPDVNFVGTSDNEALELHVNSTRALQLIPGASDAANVAGGFYGNIVDSGLNGAVIAGGGTANFSGQSSTNHVSANYSSICGGSGNWIEANADHSIIGGGWNNVVGAYQSVVAGGEANTITPGASWSVIGGGWGNSNLAQMATVAGGVGNLIQTSANQSAIGGGEANTISANDGDSTIAGGGGNNIWSNATYAVIGGGNSNTIETYAGWATIAGGYANVILPYSTDPAWSFSTISGGEDDTNFGGNYSFIGGGDHNIVGYYAEGSTIPGGFNNTVSEGTWASTVGGGELNTISNGVLYATIGGGYGNNVQVSPAGPFTFQQPSSATIGGGQYNAIVSDVNSLIIEAGYEFSATIGGGNHNNILSFEAETIGGGEYNHIITNAPGSTIVGGYGNQVANGGSYATVAGGYDNVVGGTASFAAGADALVLNNNSFVWSDGSAVTASTANDQFLVRASGGTIIYSTPGNGVGVYLASGSGSWGMVSDRNAKNNMAPVDSESVLTRVASLPMNTWSYKTEQGVRHIGPMAQDFYAAFGVGEDNKHIAEVDEGGVALAAIQGLNQKLDEKDTIIQQQAADIADLKARLEKLEQTINSRGGGGQ